MILLPRSGSRSPLWTHLSGEVAKSFIIHLSIMVNMPYVGRCWGKVKKGNVCARHCSKPWDYRGEWNGFSVQDEFATGLSVISVSWSGLGPTLSSNPVNTETNEMNKWMNEWLGWPFWNKFGRMVSQICSSNQDSEHEVWSFPLASHLSVCLGLWAR